MRKILFLCILLVVTSVQAGSIKIFKVLPHYLDKQNRHSLSPSPFERDRYQSILRADIEKCSTIRFDIQWRNTLSDLENMSITVEIRGNKMGSEPVSFTQKLPSKKSIWSKWTKIKIPEETFHKMDGIGAWRVIIQDGEKTLQEYRSFMWDMKPDPTLVK